jgi:hypothetical protein
VKYPTDTPPDDKAAPAESKKTPTVPFSTCATVTAPNEEPAIKQNAAKDFKRPNFPLINV